mgnify:CR=1 FL=1
MHNGKSEVHSKKRVLVLFARGDPRSYKGTRELIVWDQILHKAKVLGKLVPSDGKKTSRIGWRTSRIGLKPIGVG